MASFAVGERLAAMIAVTFVVTFAVVIVNDADVFPAAMLTDDGTVAVLLLLDNVTTTPPVGAAVPNETVPVDVFPPTPDAGLSVRDLTTGGLMVRLAIWITPFRFPEIATTVEVATVVVFIVNVECVLPAGIVIETGVEAVA